MKKYEVWYIYGAPLCIQFRVAVESSKICAEIEVARRRKIVNEDTIIEIREVEE